ncbi:Lactonase 7-bladed beta-propeller [Aspergillus parasiticus SU-1]|uniref:Lactonase 7-bladed beta-propeller n=1 Tax=Aspergillus parasiticus (strain ATCC 56775 / NRRL 5862 / SRRC 143 / SU-1) TaxID=1403190 RepID=A0A0F0I574_ASPPU|nr:Lactonase 7-bladed beta-propeller [Aspergillus parasiticus SU-1]
MYPSLLLALLAISTKHVLGAKHHLYSGFFSGSQLYRIQFDDETSALTVINNITTNISDGSKWIAIDEQRENIYVASGASYNSYTITSDLGLTLTSNLTISDTCANLNYIASSSSSPYTVFGAPYSTGCSGQAITVDQSGALKSIVGNITYGNSSGVHGLAVNTDGSFIYSADDMGNAVWVHSFDKTTGAVEEVQYLAAPSSANPRHLAMHPKGNYVYVIFEEANKLAVYSRDASTGKLTYTNTTYPLIPSGYTNTSSYWSDEVAFSVSSAESPKYLFASARSRSTSSPGYVTAFSLDATTGAIQEQLFLSQTTGSGGAANSVSPAIFSEDYFAITDSGSNFIEVWQVSADGSAATVAAHLDLDNGPANVVWYN